jgi:hypothetical protein
MHWVQFAIALLDNLHQKVFSLSFASEVAAEHSLGDDLHDS